MSTNVAMPEGQLTMEMEIVMNSGLVDSDFGLSRQAKRELRMMLPIAIAIAHRPYA